MAKNKQHHRSAATLMDAGVVQEANFEGLPDGVQAYTFTNPDEQQNWVLPETKLPDGWQEIDGDQEERDPRVTVETKATPEATPSPVPRMSSDRLQMRIRIPEKWQTLHPKRPGTTAYENWKFYIDGMTVSAFLESHDRRRARADLNWDLAHNFITLQSNADYMRELGAARDTLADDAAFLATGE